MKKSSGCVSRYADGDGLDVSFNRSTLPTITIGFSEWAFWSDIRFEGIFRTETEWFHFRKAWRELKSTWEMEITKGLFGLKF